MKISLYTITLSGGYYGGPAVELLDIFPTAGAWGYDGVEIEAKRPHANPMDLDSAARKDIRRAAADNGLEISCVAAYNDYASPIDEHRQNELLMTREQIRLAPPERLGQLRALSGDHDLYLVAGFGFEHPADLLPLTAHHHAADHRGAHHRSPWHVARRFGRRSCGKALTTPSKWCGKVWTCPGAARIGAS